MTVVSIDFDIIMEPSIEFYNHFSGNRGRDLFRESLLQGCNANLDTYKRLTIWLIQNINCDINFILNHQEIINFIPDNCDTLINIDHHHDLGYSDKEEPLNCGNWAKILKDEEKIKDYIWLNNGNSLNPIFYKGNIQQCQLSNYNINTITPDKIIICLSPEWVPPKFDPLFYLWTDICGKPIDAYYNWR